MDDIIDDYYLAMDRTYGHSYPHELLYVGIVSVAVFLVFELIMSIIRKFLKRFHGFKPNEEKKCFIRCTPIRIRKPCANCIPLVIDDN
jgi:hypothetical protein